MAFIAQFIAILSFALCVASLATPHHARNVHHHRAIAARAPVPAPEALPLVAVSPPRKRSSRKRCQAPNPPITMSLTTSSTSSDVSSSTPLPASTPAPVNAEPSPTITDSETSSDAQPTDPPAPTTSEAAPPADPSPTGSGDNSGQPSFMSGTQTGDGTFYATGLGACGITNNDSQFIAAVSEDLFDVYPGYDGVNPNNNPVCNRQITASYGGNSVTVTVTDRCTGCAQTSLDFSPAAFDVLADPSVGRIHGMTWVWS